MKWEAVRLKMSAGQCSFGKKMEKNIPLGALSLQEWER
jgi:hypothetical protein